MAWEDWEEDLREDEAVEYFFNLSNSKREVKVVIHLLSPACEVTKIVTIVGALALVKRKIEEIRAGGPWRISRLKDLGDADGEKVYVREEVISD